jgi:hypothetical protein
MTFATVVISLVHVLAAVTFSGLFGGWCVRMLRNRKNPPKSELKLRGLPIKPTRKNGRPESTNFQRRIQSTLETVMENGMDDDTTTRLVSRLEWWNQINRYLDMLKNTDESIDSVATGIESLMDYHQLHRPEVEEDFVDAIFTRALKDATISHLYAKLLKRMRSSDQNIVRLLFQLSVEEFNRPVLGIDDDNGETTRRQKFNNVKLMAAVFKREMPGVPDDWITNCADTLSHRLDTEATDQSVEQLCLFLTTILIAEPGENCDPILPSRQRQLLTCFEALQRAATPQKVTDDTTNVDKRTQTLNPSSSSEIDTDDPDSQSETGTESDTEEYESARDSETEPESAADIRMNQKEPNPASKMKWILMQ